MISSEPTIGILSARERGDLVAASILLPGVAIELCAFPPVHAETIVVTEPRSVLSLGLSQLLAGSEGRFTQARAPRFQRFGALSFRPAGVAAEMRVGSGACHTIRCRFDSDRLAAVGVVPEALGEAQLAACFDIHAPRIEDAMMRLAEEAGAPAPDSAALADALIGTILIDLARHLTGQQGRGRNGGLAPRHLRRVIERIEATAVPPPIDELAGLCGLSRFHFMRAFRASTGSSPAVYAQDRRMARARALLAADNRRPLRQIATELGYASVPAFSAAFRRHSGRSPAQWRACLR